MQSLTANIFLVYRTNQHSERGRARHAIEERVGMPVWNKKKKKHPFHMVYEDTTKKMQYPKNYIMTGHGKCVIVKTSNSSP